MNLVSLEMWPLTPQRRDASFFFLIRTALLYRSYMLARLFSENLQSKLGGMQMGRLEYSPSKELGPAALLHEAKPPATQASQQDPAHL